MDDHFDKFIRAKVMEPNAYMDGKGIHLVFENGERIDFEEGRIRKVDCDGTGKNGRCQWVPEDYLARVVPCG